MTRMLTDVEASEVVTGAKLGRLGCIDVSGPYVVPINYVVDGNNIYSHSLAGHKIDALRANPRACLQVDSIQDDFHWRSAVIFGVFEELTDENERNRVLRLLLARFPSLTPVESQLTRDPTPAEVIVFRLRVDRISGMSED